MSEYWWEREAYWPPESDGTYILATGANAGATAKGTTPREEAALVAAVRVKLATTWAQLEEEFAELAPVAALFP